MKDIIIRDRDREVSPEKLKRLTRKPIHVVLDNIRSAFNVGSIFRTSDAALVEKLYLCGMTAAPPNIKLQKTALGATDYVPWEYYQHTVDAIQVIKNKGILVASLELTNYSHSYIEFKFPKPVCVVFGHEILGVSKEVLELSDVIIEIPVYGFKNSINVATAFGIVVFEILRQYREYNI